MDSRELIRVSEILVHGVELVEEKLHNFPVISPVTRNELFHELEKSQNELSEIRKQIPSINVFSQVKINTLLEGIEEKIITLYGRLDDRWVDSEIAQLEEEANKLNNLIKESLNENLKEEIQLLSNEIKKRTDWMCENYRLLKKDRKVIAFARDVIKKAAEMLNGKKPFKAPHGLKETIFTPKKEEISYFEATENAIEALELFEIADLFYQNKTEMALRQYHQLSTFPKNRVDSYLSGLKERQFCGEQAFIQALINAAFELADSNDGSPVMNQEQIDILFSEAHQFRMQELWESDLSFKSKVSLIG